MPKNSRLKSCKKAVASLHLCTGNPVWVNCREIALSPSSSQNVVLLPASLFKFNFCGFCVKIDFDLLRVTLSYDKQVKFFTDSRCLLRKYKSELNKYYKTFRLNCLNHYFTYLKKFRRRLI